MMLTVAVIFAAQYSMVMLLGLQSLSVNAGHRTVAAVNSGMLGCLGFWLTASIAEAKTTGTFTPIWWAYVLAGPCGVLTAMLLHPYISKWYRSPGSK